jgi:hypothetical protein
LESVDSVSELDQSSGSWEEFGSKIGENAEGININP